MGDKTLVSLDTVVMNITLTVTIPAVVFLLGYAWGVLGYFRLPLHEYIGGRVDRLSDAARNFWHYVWALIRAAIIAVAGAWAIASIVLTVQIGMHWADVTDVYQRLDAGILGGFVITMLQILVLPNVAAWTLSYLTGAGFHIGTVEVSPAGTLPGDQPALPIFSAIPTQQALQEHWWLLLLLLLAGIVAGWWFFSTSENHLEDFVVGKFPWPRHYRWRVANRCASG